MKKLIRPQDILLLSLAGIGDLFQELSDPLMIIGKSYENVYGFVPRRYRRQNFLRSVNKSLKTGYIEKIEKNGETYLRLTTQGDKKIHRDFSLVALSKKKWDKKWRVVFFDIEEVSKRTRNRLRSKLKELGFAMLQKSVWITPHDITIDLNESLVEMGLDQFVFIIEGKALLAGDSKEMVWKIWKLDDLSKKYEEIEKKINKLKQLSSTLDDRRTKRTDESTRTLLGRKEQMRREIRMSYLQVLLVDPNLPKELLPEDWIGESVKRKLREFKGEFRG